MRQSNATDFAKLFEYLGVTQLKLEMAAFSARQNRELLTKLSKEEAAKWPPVSDELSEEYLTVIMQSLRALKSWCSALELALTEAKIDRIIERGSGKVKFDDMIISVNELIERIYDELKGRPVLFIPGSRSRYFEGKLPFGKEVHDSFPECTLDLEEAGKCFALGRWTATVFHLMRAMERVVGRLAKKAKVQMRQGSTWGQILADIANYVRAMPANSSAQRAKKARYQDLAASLHAVKDAWRNPTMHPKAVYTELDATEILNNVGAFLRRAVGTL